MRQLAFNFSGSPLPTLENFVVGRNGELVRHLKGLAAGTAQERFIYLWGRSGSGRSHLLKAAVAEFHRRGASAAYVACAPGVEIGEGLERMDCVALDGVERLDADAQVGAFRLYNVLREHSGALLGGGDAPPVQLTLREDLVTRLGWGLVYQVHGLTDEEKARALTEYAAGRGFRLAPEVCEYMLTHLKREMLYLLAALDALDRYSLETRRPVTVPLVRELLGARGERDPEGGAPSPDPGAGA
jgi:DnaA family protein